jgi:hypothetical protein
LTTHLRKTVYYHSAAPTTHLRRPEKAVPIQPSRKSRPHPTQPKKPFSFNSGKKAVPIQPSRKSRPQIKSRSNLTQMKKPSPFNPVEKAAPI